MIYGGWITMYSSLTFWCVEYHGYILKLSICVMCMVLAKLPPPGIFSPRKIPPTDNTSLGKFPPRKIAPFGKFRIFHVNLSTSEKRNASLKRCAKKRFHGGFAPYLPPGLRPWSPYVRVSSGPGGPEKPGNELKLEIDLEIT